VTVPLPRYPTDVIEQVSAMFAECRAQIEGDLICVILADHRRGTLLAEGRGLTREHFQQPDFRAIYIAAEWAAEMQHDANMLGMGIRLLLQHDHLWDPQQHALDWRRGRQSPRTIAHMAGRFEFWRIDVEQRVDALMQAVEHQRRFAELVGNLIHYAGDVIDWGMTTAPNALASELHPSTDILRMIEDRARQRTALATNRRYFNQRMRFHRKAVPA
jgi:hypothetical protein